MSEGYRGRKRSIKGWLVLPVIGLVISPISVIINLLITFLPLFQKGTITAMLTPSSEHYRPAVAVVIMAETVIDGLFVFAAIFLLVLLVLRSRFFPWGMISYYLLGFVFALSDILIAKLFLTFPEGYEPNAGPLVRGILTVGIWVPYFIVSTRVKETFVR